MSEDSPGFAEAVAAIDAAIDVEGKREPAELVYSRRMSATLGRISPQASTASGRNSSSGAST